AVSDRAEELIGAVVADERDAHLAHLVHVAGDALAVRDDDRVEGERALDLVGEPAITADDEALVAIGDDPFAVEPDDVGGLPFLGLNDLDALAVAEEIAQSLQPLRVVGEQRFAAVVVDEVEGGEAQRSLELSV